MACRQMRNATKETVALEELHRILDETMVMRLGMLDGERSYVVALNFAREGEDLWFHATSAGRKVDCLRAAARAAFDATSRFHDPAHAAAWSDTAIDAAYERVRALGLRGLAA